MEATATRFCSASPEKTAQRDGRPVPRPRRLHGGGPGRRNIVPGRRRTYLWATLHAPNQDSPQERNALIHRAPPAVGPDNPDPPLLPDPEVEGDRLATRLCRQPSPEGGASR